MAERRGERGEGLGRCLLGSAILLLGASLFLHFHLIPAKKRLWRISRQRDALATEIEDAETRYRALRAEKEALEKDPMYLERLRRRNFRLGSTRGEIFVREPR